MHFVLKLLTFLFFLAFVLTACSTGNSPIDSSAQEIAPHYVASVEIDASISQAELEAKYSAEAILFKPDAGFAVLGFEKESGKLTTLNTSVNQDAMTAPEVNAQGISSWASGISSWASGWSAWASGWSAWASGSGAASITSDNKQLWDQINLPETFAIIDNFGAGVKVAIIDSGIDMSHPAFTDKIGDKWDFVGNDSNPQEEGRDSDIGYGHGTTVAGIVTQVAPKATLMIYRVLDKDGKGDVDDVILAIDRAIQSGAQIINLSLGANVEVSALKNIIELAAQQNIFIVASAGNANQRGATYPARHTNNDGATRDFLMAIASVNQDDKKSVFSNTDDNISLTAPGENIVAPFPNNRTAQTSGTSMAAPLVTGALALAIGEGTPVDRLDALKDDLRFHGSSVMDKNHDWAYLEDRLDLLPFMEDVLWWIGAS